MESTLHPVSESLAGSHGYTFIRDHAHYTQTPPPSPCLASTTPSYPTRWALSRSFTYHPGFGLQAWVEYETAFGSNTCLRFTELVWSIGTYEMLSKRCLVFSFLLVESISTS